MGTPGTSGRAIHTYLLAKRYFVAVQSMTRQPVWSSGAPGLPAGAGVALQHPQPTPDNPWDIPFFPLPDSVNSPNFLFFIAEPIFDGEEMYFCQRGFQNS